MRRQRYELKLSRRDGRKLDHQPHPVVEEFDIEHEREEIVGKHFVPMAAAAEDVTSWLTPWRAVWEMDFLSKYQVEIWETDGYAKQPEMVSTSTHGWRN